MFRQKTIPPLALSSFALAALCLLSPAAARAQTEPQQGAINTTRSNIKNSFRTGQPGGGINGVDVVLERKSGGSAEARTLQADENGEIKVGVLPAGEYSLTLSVNEEKAAQRQLKPQDVSGHVTVEGAEGGPVKQDLLFQEDKAASTQRAGKTKFKNIVLRFRADGKSAQKVIIKKHSKPID